VVGSQQDDDVIITTAPLNPTKRPRGRPRKNPVLAPYSQNRTIKKEKGT